MGKQPTNPKGQRKSDKTCSSKSQKIEKTVRQIQDVTMNHNQKGPLDYIQEDILPYLDRPCGRRGLIFLPREWSGGLGVPENFLQGYSQKHLHRDAKQEGSRRNSLWLQQLGQLNPQTPLEDILRG